MRKEAVLPGEHFPGVNPSCLWFQVPLLLSSLHCTHQLEVCPPLSFRAGTVPRHWHSVHVSYMIQKAPRPQVLKYTFFGGLGR